jgi:hypothetical protein
METIIKVITTKEDHDIRDSAECSLSVQDVIDRLECLPKNAKIVMSNDNGYTFAPFRESTFVEVEVETRKEETERLKKEEDEDNNKVLVCPKCLTDNFCHTQGMLQCLDCGARFKRAKLIQIS